MKQHLKRLATPATWGIPRKEEKYILRPNPGGQSTKLTLPLGVALRMANVVSTMKEIKYILSRGKVLVDGKVRKDHKFGLGFLSAISIPEDGKCFRISLTTKGVLTLIAVPESESKLKIAKVMNIRKSKKGYSFTLSDGRTFISPKKFTTTSSGVLFTVPEQEVKEVFALSQGSTAFMIAGKHPGILGTIKEMKADSLTIQTKEGLFSINKGNVIVVGKEKPAITVD